MITDSYTRTGLTIITFFLLIIIFTSCENTENSDLESDVVYLYSRVSELESEVSDLESRVSDLAIKIN